MSTELSGVDLARQALVAAREAAKKNGTTRKEKPKQRTGTVVRRDGREPLGLGAAIGIMMTERGMVAPAAGGSVLAHFDTILAAAAPELAGHVQAVAFDADTGRLDVAPEAPAYGTKLRWSATEADRGGQREGARRERPRPARPGARLHAERPGGRRPGAAAGRSRRAGGAPDTAGRLPPRDRGAPPGRAAVPGGPGHRGSGGSRTAR
ncbi:DUF721 domain-containing protein [Streptomyces sp. B21-102]|uniref:DUF721 domain-containing protein n=1 Tax=unclassified Streptomyces TaxID=2593676 RepID=UPI002FEF3E86